MGEILYIPCGFRCFTKNMIKEKNKKINLQPYSLPFDNGFFSPSSIIKFIEDKECKINIENTNPCLAIKNGIWKNDESELTKAARSTWARLIKKVYEVDPLICPLSATQSTAR